jgi:hypothetical protein
MIPGKAVQLCEPVIFDRLSFVIQAVLDRVTDIT